MGRFDGKVVIITGAASGMGASHAKSFAKEGAKVAITDLQVEKGKELADDLGENAIFIKHNVTNEDDWGKVVKKVKEKFGNIDVLVNNAGITGPQEKLADFKSEDYLKLIDINQNGYFYGIKAVSSSMMENSSGAIINIASSAGTRHNKESPNFAYTTSKHAIIGMTKAAAVELAEYNISVNAINPGLIATPMMEAAWSKEQIEAATEDVPMKRLGKPSNVSDLVLFLASEESNYISGENILIDGALLAK